MPEQARKQQEIKRRVQEVLAQRTSEISFEIANIEEIEKRRKEECARIEKQMQQERAEEEARR